MTNSPVDRRVVLRILAKRIIVSPDGEIFDHELHSPFEYLNLLVDKVESADRKSNGRGSEHVLLGPSVRSVATHTPPTEPVERFLASLRFEHRSKLAQLPIDLGSEA